MPDSILEIVIRAKDEASEKLKGLGVTAQGMGTAFTVAGGVVTGALALAVKSAASAQKQTAQMDATLQSMGKASEGARDKILSYAESTVKLGFDDEAAAASTTKLFQKTGDLNKAMELNNLAMDLAAAKNLDLETASKMVGMVLSGNGKVLKEYGIDLKEMGTPTEALAELHSKLAFQAQNVANSFEGQQKVMSETFSNLVDQVGGVLIPILTDLLKKVTPIITKITEWINQNPELTKKIVLVVAAVGSLMVVLGPLLLALPMLVAGVGAFITILGLVFSPIGLIVIAIAGLVAGIVFLIKNWDAVKAKTAEVWDSIMGTVSKGVDYVVGKINKVIGALKSIGGKAASMLGFGDVEGRATGGSVTGGTPYIVGEQGAELFVPGGSGTIIPNFAMAGRGGTTNLIITGNTFMGDREAVRQITDTIMDNLKRSAKIGL